LVYDITDPKSFDCLDDWKEQFLKEACPEEAKKFPFVLIGNKVDLEEERKVDKKKVEDWVQQRGGNMKFVEASAFSGTNVSQAFDFAANLADEYFKGGTNESNAREQPRNSALTTQRSPSTSKGCAC